jgi:DnaA family protein
MQTAQPDILHNIESNQLVCFDDVDVIIGHFEWEEALFHCFNRLKQLGRQIVMAAKYNPASLAFALPDLGSRLATSLVFQLPDMTDEDKQQALIKQAKFKGLELDDATALYLLRHCGRDMHTLIAILDKLDKASLRAQRRLTIPFIRDVTSES